MLIGEKLKVVHAKAGMVHTMEYVGNHIYEDGVLKQTLIEGGYLTYSGNTPAYHFYVKDHLGNNRMVMSASGAVEQVVHYYPYGMAFADGTNADAQRFKYNGKELDAEDGLNWMDYGARMYDAALARWNKVDRYSEKYYSMSGYSYCGGEPVGRVDINGDSLAVLIAPEGAAIGGVSAGHMAIMIQDEGGKWCLYSKNGTDENHGSYGPNRSDDSENRPNDIGELKYETIAQFLNDTKNNPTDLEGRPEYTEAFVIPCTKMQDRDAEKGARSVLKEDYNVLFSNCAQTVQHALRNAGLKEGNKINFSPSGIKYETREYIPKRVYINIKDQNKNGYVY